MSDRLTVQVPEGAAGSRADRFLADLSGLSRARVQRLIGEGRATQDTRALRSNDLVRAGATVELDVPDAAPTELVPEDRHVSVVYEDDDLLIVDKPAGVVTHPSPGHASGTLAHALLSRSPEVGDARLAGAERPGIVHRLDRDTSGLVLVAKSERVQAALMAQLRARRVKKEYVALVGGEVAAMAGRVEAPIGRDPRHRTRMAVVPDGRPSVTGYRVRERFEGWTYLELDLVTGRTHQIRVHLASIGHPIAGDPVYATSSVRRGPLGLTRMFLHASRLELASPSAERLIRATAPLPDELEAVLEGLRPQRGRPT